MTRARWAPVLAGVVALAAAWPAVRNGWSDFDESFYVRDNLLLRSARPVDLLALTTSPGAGAQYQPVTMLSYAASYQVCGDDPRRLHAVDVLLYALVTALVALVALRVARDAGLTAREGGWASLAAGALFAVHPIHVESYAWISDRKDLLAASLALVAFLLFRRARRARPGQRARPLVGALVAFLLALGAKVSVAPLAIAMGFDAALLDPVARAEGSRARTWRGARAAGPLLLTGLFASVGWAMLQRGAPTALNTQGPTDLLWRLAFALRCGGHYVRTIAYPVDLVFYYWPTYTWGAWAAPLASLAVAAAGLGVLLRRPGPHRVLLGLGAAWFGACLAPYVGIVWSGQYAADRYAFLSSAGVAVVTGSLLALLGRRLGKRAVLAGTLLVTCALLVASQRRVQVWRDAGTLWSSTLAVQPEHPIALAKLAAFRRSEGRTDDALALLERAHDVAPDYGFITLILAWTVEQRGDEARAEALRASVPRVQRLLGLASRAAAAGDLAGAEALLREHTARFPKDGAAHARLAELLLRSGDPSAALVEANAAVAIGATVEAVHLAAQAARLAGQPELAARHMSLLERTAPSWRTDLLAGQLALDRGDSSAAARRLRTINPADLPTAAVNTLAIGLAQAGALRDGLRVLRLRRGDLTAEGLYTLARLERLTHAADAGAAALRAAIALDPRLDERAKGDPVFADGPHPPSGRR